MDAVTSTASYAGRSHDRRALAPVPLGEALGIAALGGPLFVEATVRAGYALARTRWLVRGSPLVDEGSVAVEAGAAVGLEWDSGRFP